MLLFTANGGASRRCLAQMSAPPPRPWNFARLQERPRYASWPSFGSAARKTRTVLRDLKLSGPILSRIAAYLLRKGAVAAMPPPRMFQRRRRQLFALMGQPLLFPFLAVLLAAQCCSAQPHAREDHAQHIMNQARANQKASRPVCAILASAAASPRRHRAVKDVASMAHASHRWRTGPPRA